MTTRQQWTAVIGVLGLMLVAAVAFLRWDRNELLLVSPGSHAPEFHAAALTTPTTPRSLRDYRGQVVLLNVWATWCQPCAVEMPSIERLYQAYQQQGLKVVAVSIDSGDAADSAVRDFTARYGLTFEILRDPAGHIEQQYQTTGYPETFVIGRDGVIRKKVIGASDWDSEGDRALIAQLLREPSA
jgi:cytochrome c biogenesis protein CcmG, thiol:disulfide interchange protein DsbE